MLVYIFSITLFLEIATINEMIIQKQKLLYVDGDDSQPIQNLQI